MYIADIQCGFSYNDTPKKIKKNVKMYIHVVWLYGMVIKKLTTLFVT